MKHVRVSAALTQRVVEVTVIAAGRDFGDAADLAQSTIRTAIHAAGGHTPRWKAPVFAPTASAAELVATI